MIDLDQCLVDPQQYDPYYKHSVDLTGPVTVENHPEGPKARTVDRAEESGPLQAYPSRRPECLSGLTPSMHQPKATLLKMNSPCSLADSKKKKKSHLSRDELARVCQQGEVKFESYNGSTYMIAIRSLGDRKSLIGYRCDWNNCGYMNARVERMFGHIRSQHPEAPPVKKLVTTSATPTTPTLSTCAPSSLPACLTPSSRHTLRSSSSPSAHSSPSSLSPRAFKTPPVSSKTHPCSPSPSHPRSLHSPSSSLSASPESAGSSLLSALCAQPPPVPSEQSDVVLYSHTRHSFEMEPRQVSQEDLFERVPAPPTDYLSQHMAGTSGDAGKCESRLIGLLNGNGRSESGVAREDHSSQVTSGTDPLSVDRNNNETEGGPSPAPIVVKPDSPEPAQSTQPSLMADNGTATAPVPAAVNSGSNGSNKENELGLLRDIECLLMEGSDEPAQPMADYPPRTQPYQSGKLTGQCHRVTNSLCSPR